MKKITIYILATFGVVLGGCSDFLDKVPDERTDIDTPEKISALLVNAYPQVSFAALVNSRCDNITDFGSTYYGGQPDGLFNFIGENYIWKDVIESGNDTFEKFWTGCYRAIAIANHALEAIEEYPDKSKVNVQYGEARMARAFSHFYLASLFARHYNPASAHLLPGIPYVTDPENVPIKKYQRGTVESTYKNIMEDFEEGFKYMTEGSAFKARSYHFTADAASAFGTRLYLMTRDYDQVIKLATNIIAQPTEFVTLVDSEGTPLLNADGTKQENVSPNDRAVRDAESKFHPFSTGYLSLSSSDRVRAAFTSSAAESNLLITEATSSLPWAEGFVYTRYGSSLKDLNNTFYARNATYSGTWTYPVYGTSSAVGIFYFVPKYQKFYDLDAIDASSYIPYSNIPVLRVEEALLNRAEAYIMKDEYDLAIADLNIFASQRITDNPDSNTGKYDPGEHCITRDKLLTVYGTAVNNPEHYINKYNNITGDNADLKKALILALLNCKEVEFYNEGIRWYDIVRWNIPVTHTLYGGGSITLAPDDDRRVLQIPEAAVMAGIEPNPRTNVGQ